MCPTSKDKPISKRQGKKKPTWLETLLLIMKIPTTTEAELSLCQVRRTNPTRKTRPKRGKRRIVKKNEPT